MSDEIVDPPLWVKRQILREYVSTFEELPIKHQWQLLALCGRRLPFLAKLRLTVRLLVA